MKPVQFTGRTLNAIRAFPDTARRETGLQLDRLQRGLNPVDWRPMPSIGQGVREIRIRAIGQFRVIYMASLRDRIVVLHAFRKKTRQTRKSDLEKARQALNNVLSSIQK